MDEILQRFVRKAPIAVLVRASLARILDGAALDDLFRRHAQLQYTRELTFSTLTHLMIQVVTRAQPSVHAAYRHCDDIPVSVTSVYNKLDGLELPVSQALVRETARDMQALIAELHAPRRDSLKGLHLRTLDGNFLAGTDHRLGDLRDCGAAALPGMTLAVRDGRTGLLTDLIPCEDAYTNERALCPAVLELVEPEDLGLADRNFCTEDYLGGIAARGAYFLIRHHAGTKLHPLGPAVRRGRNGSGTLREQRVRVGASECRCIILRLRQPLRDGTTELRLLTNVPATRLSARRLAALYRTRWQIETAFQDLTTTLRCELNTLGYPKAALFGFALAAVAYNVLMVIQAALAAGLGEEVATTGLSNYHLANEVASVTEGLAIAVPESIWRDLARLPAGEFAAWMRAVAEGIDWRRYRKNPRGPKKPRVVQRTQRGAHRSTARVLKDHQEKRARQE